MSRKEQADMGGFQEKETPGSGKGIRVLVVDDMVTARMLMRNIFETAGFQVRTANDGIEALTLLRGETFDAVVTDIEMPRMDGVELCKAIRTDSNLSGLPVVLVTNMTSREDRERGVTAGANAYFVKSSFDSANLLQVVASLVV
jgi:two-component system chemotaxis sensor kinase CheA